MDKKIETVVETVYEQQCKEVTVPECDIITVVVTEAGKKWNFGFYTILIQLSKNMPLSH